MNGHNHRLVRSTTPSARREAQQPTVSDCTHVDTFCPLQKCIVVFAEADQRTTNPQKAAIYQVRVSTALWDASGVSPNAQITLIVVNADTDQRN